MITKTLKVNAPTGLDMGLAGLFCETAMRYRSKITFVVHDNYEANAKSVLSVLGASVMRGDEIVLTCEGEDESEATAAIEEILK